MLPADLTHQAKWLSVQAASEHSPSLPAAEVQLGCEAQLGGEMHGDFADFDLYDFAAVAAANDSLTKLDQGLAVLVSDLGTGALLAGETGCSCLPQNPCLRFCWQYSCACGESC